MSFTTKDKVENTLKLAVGEMDKNELVKYFVRKHKIENKYEAVADTADHQIVQKFLIDQYGQPHAGRIIKWLFYRYGGKVTVRGNVEFAALRSFNSSMKWWVDKLNAEQQLAVREDDKATDESAWIGKGFT